MSTGFKKYLSITTCLFFIVIGCAIQHQSSNRLDTNEESKSDNSSTYDVGLDTSNEKNPKKTGNTKDFEKDGLGQHNFGENGVINSSLSGYSNGALIRPTTYKTGPNTYSQSAQDRDDDDSDDDDDDDNDDRDDYDDDDDNDDDDDYRDDYDDDYRDDYDDDDDDYHYGNVLFDDPTDAGRPSPSFQDDILPILMNRCAFAGCHVAGGPGGIDLRTYDALIAGGSKGAIVIAGNARRSELVEQIVEGEMPPSGPPLPASQIQLIIDWINEGAKNNLNNETEGKSLIPSDPFSPWDVNRDGVVTILDLIHAALQFGQVGTHLAGDVNGDGKVDVSDLVLISVGLSENAAAPAPSIDDSNPTANYHPSSVKRQFQALAALESLATPSREARLARDMLKAWLSRVKPLITETKLLPNYPNPFNPETWIPYQLAEAAHVKIHIYDVVGDLVRTLNLGTKLAGGYLSREKAAYWDGRNDMGEVVSSGVYFYTLVIRDYQTTRRMIVAR